MEPLLLARPCDILIVTDDASVVLRNASPMIDQRGGRVCAMLRVGRLFSVQRRVRLDLDGHITLFYVDDACVPQGHRDLWEKHVRDWLVRMQDTAVRLLVDERKSGASYGILDIMPASPIHSHLHQLVANSTRDWLCRVKQRPWLHLSFEIPLPVIAEHAIRGIARCPELLPIPASLQGDLNPRLFPVTCFFCGGRGILQDMLQCDTCDHLVCYGTCSVRTAVHVPFTVGRRICIQMCWDCYR